MNVEALDETGRTMAEDSYACFLAALRHKMRQAKYTQLLLAEKTGSSPQWINALVRERTDKSGKTARASVELQESICELFGYSYMEFLRLGERIIENIPGGHIDTGQADKQERPNQQLPLSIPGVDAKYVNPMDVIAAIGSVSESFTAAATAVSVLAKQCQDETGEKRFWRAMFENLPASVVIVQDGIVHKQNIKSRDLGAILGKPFCENCAGPDCENKDICPVHIATTMAKPASGYKIIKELLYKLDVEYVRFNDHEYLIILATEAKSDMVPFNRRKVGDRRKDQEDGE